MIKYCLINMLNVDVFIIMFYSFIVQFSAMPLKSLSWNIKDVSWSYSAEERSTGKN